MNAQEYIKHWEGQKVWNRLSMPKHMNRLTRCAEAVRGGKTFIDVGCAFGHSTAIMRDLSPGLWLGVDFCQEAIEKARLYFADLPFLYVTPEELAEHTPFDGVVCSEVIEHVEDDKAFVHMLWKITGKRLVVSTPCVEVGDPGHLRLYTEEMLRELFKDVPGAKIERTRRFFYITATREA